MYCEKRRAAKRVARAAAVAVAPTASSSSSSATLPTPSSLPLPAAKVVRRGETGNFKHPQIPKRKSVVIALKPSSSSFPSVPTAAPSSASKRVSSCSDPLPSSSGSSSKESLVPSSSCEPSPKRSRTSAYELKKQLLRHHEATTKILSLLELPAGIVSTELVAECTIEQRELAPNLVYGRVRRFAL